MEFTIYPLQMATTPEPPSQNPEARVLLPVFGRCSGGSEGRFTQRFLIEVPLLHCLESGNKHFPLPFGNLGFPPQ